MLIYNGKLSLAALLMAGVLSSCGGSGSSGSAQDSTAEAATASLQKQWETDTSVRAPESVLWDGAKNLFYVSNIDGDGSAKDGNGFIAQLGADGQVLNLHWIDGLDAPKGLGMHGGELYAADLDSLVVIDIGAAKIKSKVYAPGATFLNDVAVDGDGNVYVSDSRQGKIYRYVNGEISVYLDNAELKGVNGLLCKPGQLWILAAGGIYTYDQTDQQIQLFSDAVKGGDGLAAVNDSDFLASRWVGEVYYVHGNGTADKLLDTQNDHKNTADIDYVAEKQLLVIPTFTGNTVAGYTLNP
jgi:sugar lactone lactonase YvrE